MPAFLIPLHEANDCHAPAGSPAGGQFCTKKAWHLTDNPHFVPDPTRKPELNRVFLSDLMADPTTLPAGLFVTDAPEYWMQAHGYERPYVAEVEGVVAPPQPGAARVGREEFMQGKNMKTVRVLTLDEYARETFHEPGWVEDYLDSSSSIFGPRKKFPANYKGRSVDQMTPAEIKDWERRFKLWTQRSR